VPCTYENIGGSKPDIHPHSGSLNAVDIHEAPSYRKGSLPSPGKDPNRNLYALKGTIRSPHKAVPRAARRNDAGSRWDIELRGIKGGERKNVGKKINTKPQHFVLLVKACIGRPGAGPCKGGFTAQVVTEGNVREGFLEEKRERSPKPCPESSCCTSTFIT